MKQIRTHYDNLQVKENASDEVIRGAYRYLSQKWHPDKNPGNQQEAERILKIINDAYAVLSDPAKRREHDACIARQNSDSKNKPDETSPNDRAKIHSINWWSLIFGTAIICLCISGIFYVPNKGVVVFPLIYGLFLLKDSNFFHASALNLRSKPGASNMQPDQFEYAGFWSRVGAGIIDLILLLVVTVPLLIAFYGKNYFSEQNTLMIAGPADLFINYVLPAVCTILFWWHKQATPGKMVISARIVDAKTGSNLTVGQAIGRYFAYFVATLPLGIGLLWIAFDARKQGWHDKLAGTVVIRPRHRGPDPVRFGD